MNSKIYLIDSYYNLEAKQRWYASFDKCEICGKKFYFDSDKVIDHDHKTGEIRGIVCRSCNLRLGIIENYKTFINPELKDFYRYLNEYKQDSKICKLILEGEL